MGNKVNKNEYITINGNAVICDDFDNMSLANVNLNSDTNTNNTNSINNTNTTGNPKVDINTNKLEKLTKLVNAVDCKEGNNNLEKIFKDYSENVILDYYESDSAITIFKRNDNKALQLAHNLPKNDRQLMFKYFSKVPTELILVMSKNINFNAVNDKGETFLYQYDVIKENLDSLCAILENVNDININLIVKNRTFLEELIRYKELPNNETKLVTFFELLEKRNYNFNKFCYYKDTFLTQTLVNIPKMKLNFANTMKLKSFDITIESRWLYHILTHFVDDVHNYIYYMFQRDDYKKLFMGLYSNLYIDMWGDKFIVFLKKACSLNDKKTFDCINYKNEKGDTIIHLMAECHDKQTLQFAVRYFKQILQIGANDKGKTPLMLYEESNFKNILESKSNI